MPARLDLLWKFLKPVSFSLIGKEINFAVLDGRVVGYGALLVLLGSLVIKLDCFATTFASLQIYFAVRFICTMRWRRSRVCWWCAAPTDGIAVHFAVVVIYICCFWLTLACTGYCCCDHKGTHIKFFDNEQAI